MKENRINVVEHINCLHKEFSVASESIMLFERIAGANVETREDILKDVALLIKSEGLSYSLAALFRQQVNCGFVLADPLTINRDQIKTFFDSNTKIPFRIQWNQYRQIRRNHQQLIDLGIISDSVNHSELVNIDKDGKACYLCKENIDKQNPLEILLEIELAEQQYFVGANFAFITNNHFTIMNASHIPQYYRKGVVETLNDFVEKTDGYFRAIFNGLAGASIKEHEHIQVTTERLPIEDICVKSEDVIYNDNYIKVIKPEYYTTVWFVEGKHKLKVNAAVDEVVSKWLNLNLEYHTMNLLSTMDSVNKVFRTFIILRDKRMLSGGAKLGAMATFETGGNVILSCVSNKNAKHPVNEKDVLKNADLETIKRMLIEIAPDKDSSSLLTSLVDFKG